MDPGVDVMPRIKNLKVAMRMAARPLLATRATARTIRLEPARIHRSLHLGGPWIGSAGSERRSSSSNLTAGPGRSPARRRKAVSVRVSVERGILSERMRPAFRSAPYIGSGSQLKKPESATRL